LWLSILDAVDPDCDFQDWFKLGAAGKALGDARAFDDWAEWSRRGKKYGGDRNLRSRWAKMTYGHVGTAINIGKRYGWQPPRKRTTAEWFDHFQSENFERWEALRAYTPDLTVQGDYVELPDDLRSNDASVAIKAGLGAGKTQELIAIHKAQNNGAHLINARNSLQIQTLSRFRDGGVKGCYHVRKDDARKFLRDTGALFASCPDTALSFEPHDYDDRALYLDEWSGTIKHYLLGGTLGSRQAQALDKLETAASLARKSILLDGNLKDWEIDYLEKISGKKIIKVKHKAKSKPRNIYFIDASKVGENQAGFEDPDNLKSCNSPLIKLIEDRRCFVVTDSIRFTKSIAEFIQQSDPTKKILVVNAQTVGDDSVAAFLNNPKKEAKNYDLILISPTAVSGIDVHADGHFDCVVGVFFGVLMVDDLTQILFRLRDNVPTYIACPDKGLPVPRYYPKAFKPEDVAAQIKAQSMLNIELLEKQFDGKKTEAQIKADIDNAEIVNRAKKIYETGEDAHFDALCKLIAMENYERQNLRACLTHTLKQAGHNVEDLILAESKTLKDGLKQKATEIDFREAKAIRSARQLDDTEADRLQRKENLTQSERFSLARYRIDAMCPGLTESAWFDEPIKKPKSKKPQSDDELETQGEAFCLKVAVKKSDYLRAIERHLLLSHPELSELKHEKSWYSRIRSELGQEFRGRLMNAPHLVIWALNEMGIMRLMMPGEHTHKSSLWADLISRGRDGAIALALGIVPPPDDAPAKDKTEYIKALAELAGIPLKSKEKRDKEGKKMHIYSFDEEGYHSESRQDITTRIMGKLTEWQEATIEALNWAKVLAEYDNPVTIDSGTEPELPPDELELMRDGPDIIDPALLRQVVTGLDPVEQYDRLLAEKQAREAEQAEQAPSGGEWVEYALDSLTVGSWALWQGCDGRELTGVVIDQPDGRKLDVGEDSNFNPMIDARFIRHQPGRFWAWLAHNPVAV
jgi:hypothetical protein